MKTGGRLQFHEYGLQTIPVVEHSDGKLHSAPSLSFAHEQALVSIEISI